MSDPPTANDAFAMAVPGCDGSRDDTGTSVALSPVMNSSKESARRRSARAGHSRQPASSEAAAGSGAARGNTESVQSDATPEADGAASQRAPRADALQQDTARDVGSPQPRDATPQLPHERDESSDRDGGVRPHPDPVGGRAHEDLKRGLVDTDRSVPLDATYKRLRR